MNLSNLRPAEGSKHSDNFRRGRGHGSGNGKTAGKGHKGQNARSGGGVRPGFEGGQMPLTRRVPKRGFNNHFRKVYAIVNLEVLSAFEAGTVVNYDILLDMGLIKDVKGAIGLKVLGNGEINNAITVQAAKFSASAKQAIEEAGGTIEVIE